MTRQCTCLNCITPPHLLRKLIENKDRDIRQAALNTLLATQQLRGMRAALGFSAAAGSGQGRRTIFDCRNSTNLPAAAVVRTEEGEVSPDASVNRAHDGLGATRDFYRDVLGRNSIDDLGMRLNGYVHRGDRYNNAFWDGREMVFGDGDGILFTDFTSSLDVIGHELTHGVTEFTAGLEYHNQSGALNEHMSDVFGSLVKQWSNKQTAQDADWLIGAEVFTPALRGDALRSMKAPGTAYDNSDLGKDPQPDHMSRYVNLPDTDEGDNGGVHINSGIPNKAFYLTSISIGGCAWEAPGHIWYESLRASSPNTQFQEFANTTHAKASAIYGGSSVEQQAVLAAWREVGIQITGVPPGKGNSGKPEDSLIALVQKLDSLSLQVKMLVKDVSALKDRK
jgi:Zn-dependent metalloprotease